MTTALLGFDDGRFEYATASLQSAMRCLPKFDQYIFVDDRHHKLGYAGAIQQAWSQVQTDFVFHLELDFTFNHTVPVDRMIELLVRHPYLVQVSLKRQPWNGAEIKVGGIVELNPDRYTERREDDLVWTEHREYFTCNPTVYSSALCRLGWPQVPQSEHAFIERCLTPAARFAIWGGKFDPPFVHHIGNKRAGTGY